MLAAHLESPQDCRTTQAEGAKMPAEFAEGGARALRAALPLMMKALDLLDGAGVAPEVATHLQLAISEARCLLGGEAADS